jgi:ABC-type multidrug transport system ATPase subunit
MTLVVSQPLPSVSTSILADSTPAWVVQADHLSKSLDGRVILRDVSLQVKAGELIAILGANGAGKSTLLKIIATLMPPSSGELRLFGQSPTASIRTATALRQRIGMVGHQLMLYRDLSPRENLEFFARLYDLPDPAAKARRMIDMVGLGSRADDPIKTFSRGMAQRVAIARALLHDPQLLLADEPFTGLDASSSTALEDLLQQITRQAGKTVVLVNHDLEQALRLSGRVVVLSGGRVALDEASDRVTAQNLLREISV